jgi:nicotinate dehydrogenase subunit B
MRYLLSIGFVAAKRRRRVVGVFAGVIVLASAGFTGLAWHPAIAPASPPRGFPQNLVVQGAGLAAIGDCAVCHTSDGGAPYAGGRPIRTPFGVIYSANITPDVQSGLGRWPEAAFVRAMRSGVDRSGALLYPAFPYVHFGRLTDGDLHALYAFVMTRAAVHQVPPENHLVFPLGIRAFVAAWNLLFMRVDPPLPDPRHDAVWNRGAYLVEGLGHCGACHSGRNFLGAERSPRFRGGEVDDWSAPPLGAASLAPLPWTEAQLFAYLRTGTDDNHGAAAGPMQNVVHALKTVSDAELAAMARYVASFSGPAAPAARAAGGSAAPEAEGAMIFAGACAACHAANAPMRLAGRPSLALSSSLREPDLRNARHIIRNGLRPAAGEAGAWMPAFADILTPDQIEAVLRYLRAASDGPTHDRLAADAKARNAP